MPTRYADPRIKRTLAYRISLEMAALARLLVRPTPFKHVGVFPEQATNWGWLVDLKDSFDVERPRVLNLFGYSGAASIVAVLLLGWAFFL